MIAMPGVEVQANGAGSAKTPMSWSFDIGVIGFVRASFSGR